MSEIIVPEAEVVDSESTRSGNVLVQLIHPGRLTIPFAGDLHLLQCNKL